MEALAYKFRTSPSPSDKPFFSSLYSHRRNTAVILNFFCSLEPISIRSEGRQQTRSEHGASTRETGKDFSIWMFRKNIAYLLIIFVNMYYDTEQLLMVCIRTSITDVSIMALSVVSGLAIFNGLQSALYDFSLTISMLGVETVYS